MTTSPDSGSRQGFWTAIRRVHLNAMTYAVSKGADARAGAVIGVAYVVGMLLAYAACSVLPVSMADVEEAKRLGISLSVTVSSGYSKAHEVTVYVVSQLVVVGVVFGVWWAWCARSSLIHTLSRASRRREATAAPGAESGPRRASWRFPWRLAPVWIDWVLVPLVVAFVAFDRRLFGSMWLGTWAFLSEEGVFLSGVDAVLRGGALYRDDYTSYAPLMFYPVKWMMEAFDATVVMLRAYAFLADIAGYLILYHVLRTFLRHRGWSLLGVGFFLVNFSLVPAPGIVFRPSIHESVLRFAIGLAWIPFFFRTWVPLKRDLILAGIALGLAMTFSQEIGLVSCLSFVLVTVSAPLWGAPLSRAIRDAAWVAGGGALAVVPWVGLFMAQGTLDDAFYTLFVFPQYYGLGLGGLPFPPPAVFWHAVPQVLQWVPGANALSITKGYWIPFVFSLGAVALAMRLAMGRLDHEDRMLLALLLIGGMVFRTALGRSDIVHFQVPLVPAVVLGIVLFRRVIMAVTSGSVPLVSSTTIVAGLVVLASAAILQPPRPVWKAFLHTNVWSVGEKFTPPAGGTREVSGVPRARGVRLPTAFADEFEGTVRYIATHTEPQDRIVAFPNEAAYYFYTERERGTRYPMASNAVTAADREAMVAEMVERRPRYLIYSLATVRVDNLDERLVFPELIEYIRTTYVPETRIGDTVILRRRDAAPPGT